MSAKREKTTQTAPSGNDSGVVEIYCDGARSGNPGPGGYGAILRYNGREKEISGAEGHTTNNRMEMTAAIEAFRSLTRPCRVRVTTDSQYLVKGITEWIHAWQRKGWQNSKKEPVLNRDLWEELLRLTGQHTITWHWVRGHAGHAENERCDCLAREALSATKNRD